MFFSLKKIHTGFGRDGGKEGLYEYVKPAWQTRPRPKLTFPTVKKIARIEKKSKNLFNTFNHSFLRVRNVPLGKPTCLDDRRRLAAKKMQRKPTASLACPSIAPTRYNTSIKPLSALFARVDFFWRPKFFLKKKKKFFVLNRCTLAANKSGRTGATRDRCLPTRLAIDWAKWPMATAKVGQRNEKEI